MVRVFNNQWILIEIIIFYCVLSSARASCTLGQNTYVDLFLTIIVFLYFFSNKLFETSLLKRVATISFILAVCWTMHGLMLHAYVGEVVTAAIPLMLFNLKQDKQLELLEFISKALAITLIISYFAWLASFLGFEFPATTEYFDLDYTYGVINKNHFLYLKVVNLDSTGQEIIQNIVRFNGIFLEPGHTGTIIAFFLIANRYDFSKWYVKILIFILIVTLSAAAYLLAFLGYIFIAVVEGKAKKNLLQVFILMSLLFIVSQYNNGDNIINNVVFDKLFNSDRGLENRFTGEVSNAYDMLWMRHDYLLGLSGDVNVAHSAGYKVFIIQQGLFGAFLVLFAYFLMYKSYNSHLGFFFFIITMLSFLQRVYFTWDAYLDPYILGLSNFTIIKNKIYKK